MSESDRLLARSNEFAASDLARSAIECWRDWHSPSITSHDGLVREGQPALLTALERVQSASSLAKLLRNPLGFTWRYALGVNPPQAANKALVLDAREAGLLLHDILDEAVQLLEEQKGLAESNSEEIRLAVSEAAKQVSSNWLRGGSVPPDMIWRRTIEDTSAVACKALQHSEPPLPNQKSYTEVAFGRDDGKSARRSPWEIAKAVPIPTTGFHISGYIDRLDLSGDRTLARLIDYKGGRTPPETIALNGGAELQRCLYAYAVKALLGDGTEIEAVLLYPRDDVSLRLQEPGAALQSLIQYLRIARASLLSGKALIGPDSGGEYDDFRFALPANASNGYCPRKLGAVKELMADASLVWEAP
nr:PD-(D/E)XK nuclease family protein [Altererythrobacter sp. TH136]